MFEILQETPILIIEGFQTLLLKVWPGVCVFADYTNDATRDWWRDHAVKFHDRLPFDGFWIVRQFAC